MALLRDCTDTREVIYTRPTDLPAFSAERRGDVVRCGRVATISAEALTAQAIAQHAVVDPLPSGATIYRIAYRTERVPAPDGTTREALSSALLLVPSRPRGEGLTVVYGHPTVGLADSCAPSLQDLLGPADDWYPALGPLLALVGAGYTVIAPDFAGYGYGDAPSFALADDVSRSVLDATRAAAAVVPRAHGGTEVAFVGHSLGGHAVLSAYAHAASYGMSGELVGVVGIAPLWLSPYGFGALIAPGIGYNTTDAGYAIQYSIAYLYTHAELLDGPGAGAALFKPEARDAAVALIRNHCVNEVASMLPSLGAVPADFVDEAFASEVGPCGIGGECDTPLAMLWASRFQADRPAIPANGPPVVMWFSRGDTTITPGFGRCAMDRLNANVAGGTTVVESCLDPVSPHTDVPVDNIGWVSDWLAAKAFGEAEPAACTPIPASQACQQPPPNL